MKHKHITIIRTDFGNRVICDLCGDDYTNRTEQGGILFQSKAFCPTCAVEELPKIKAYEETHLIRGTCPAGVSFRDWVLSLRNGNNTVTQTTVEMKEE